MRADLRLKASPSSTSTARATPATTDWAPSCSRVTSFPATPSIARSAEGTYTCEYDGTTIAHKVGDTAKTGAGLFVHDAVVTYDYVLVVTSGT